MELDAITIKKVNDLAESLLKNGIANNMSSAVDKARDIVLGIENKPVGQAAETADKIEKKVEYIEDQIQKDVGTRITESVNKMVDSTKRHAAGMDTAAAILEELDDMSDEELETALEDPELASIPDESEGELSIEPEKEEMPTFEEAFPDAPKTDFMGELQRLEQEVNDELSSVDEKSRIIAAEEDEPVREEDESEISFEGNVSSRNDDAPARLIPPSGAVNLDVEEQSSVELNDEEINDLVEESDIDNNSEVTIEEAADSEIEVPDFEESLGDTSVNAPDVSVGDSFEVSEELELGTDLELEDADGAVEGAQVYEEAGPSYVEDQPVTEVESEVPDFEAKEAVDAEVVSVEISEDELDAELDEDLDAGQLELETELGDESEPEVGFSDELVVPEPEVAPEESAIEEKPLAEEIEEEVEAEEVEHDLETSYSEEELKPEVAGEFERDINEDLTEATTEPTSKAMASKFISALGSDDSESEVSEYEAIKAKEALEHKMQELDPTFVSSDEMEAEVSEEVTADVEAGSGVAPRQEMSPENYQYEESVSLADTEVADSSEAIHEQKLPDAITADAIIKEAEAENVEPEHESKSYDVGAINPNEDGIPTLPESVEAEVEEPVEVNYTEDAEVSFENSELHSDAMDAIEHELEHLADENEVEEDIDEQIGDVPDVVAEIATEDDEAASYLKDEIRAEIPPEPTEEDEVEALEHEIDSELSDEADPRDLGTKVEVSVESNEADSSRANEIPPTPADLEVESSAVDSGAGDTITPDEVEKLKVELAEDLSIVNEEPEEFITDIGEEEESVEEVKKDLPEVDLDEPPEDEYFEDN